LYATLARKHIIGAQLGAQPLDKLKASHVEAWRSSCKAGDCRTPRSARLSTRCGQASTQP
jgi:hypothetical protein